jgi:hypothetical protein
MSFSVSDLAESSQTNQPAAPSQATPAVGTFSAQDLGGVEAENLSTPPQIQNDPRKTGEITNDVGQKVIVPKEGESFSDTMKRAVAYHKSLTPEQQQAALDARQRRCRRRPSRHSGQRRLSEH